MISGAGGSMYKAVYQASQKDSAVKRARRQQTSNKQRARRRVRKVTGGV